MSKEQVLRAVKEMIVESDEIHETVYYLSQATEVEIFNFWNVFHYGYIIGKREERAKKKKALN